jgi:hypothetical protein
MYWFSCLTQAESLIVIDRTRRSNLDERGHWHQVLRLPHCLGPVRDGIAINIGNAQAADVTDARKGTVRYFGRSDLTRAAR